MAQLREAGFKAVQAKDSGHTAADVKAAGYTAAEVAVDPWVWASVKPIGMGAAPDRDGRPESFLARNHRRIRTAAPIF